MTALSNCVFCPIKCDNSLDKLLSIKDLGHTDCVITPTRAGLHRCRWPRPCHAARLAALVRSYDVSMETYYYGHQSIIIVIGDAAVHRPTCVAHTHFRTDLDL